MRQGRRIGAVLIIIIGALLLYNWYSRETHSQAKALPVHVKAQRLTIKLVQQRLEAVASVKAFESITLTVNISEYVVKLHFDDGQVVKKGDLLVELETGEEKALLDEARARVKEAELHYQRMQDLRKKNFSSQSEVDAQEADLLSAQAKLAQIQAQIKDRNLYAPFDGILGFRRVSEGTLVEPGDEIVTLDMLNPVKVDFSLPEVDLANVQVKQLVYGSSEAYPDRKFNGHIATISPRMDEETRSIQVRAIFNNQDLALKPGMLLQVFLPLPAIKRISIPEEALLAEGMNRFVYIVVQGEAKVRKIKVKPLQRRGKQVDILGDFPENSFIITEGAFKLKPDQQVDVDYVDR